MLFRGNSYVIFLLFVIEKVGCKQQFSPVNVTPPFNEERRFILHQFREEAVKHFNVMNLTNTHSNYNSNGYGKCGIIWLLALVNGSFTDVDVLNNQGNGIGAYRLLSVSLYIMYIIIIITLKGNSRGDDLSVKNKELITCKIQHTK